MYHTILLCVTYTKLLQCRSVKSLNLQDVRYCVGCGCCVGDGPATEIVCIVL